MKCLAYIWCLQDLVRLINDHMLLTLLINNHKLRNEQWRRNRGAEGAFAPTFQSGGNECKMPTHFSELGHF